MPAVEEGRWNTSTDPKLKARADIVRSLKAWKAEFDRLSEQACSYDLQIVLRADTVQYVGRRNKTLLEVAIVEETKI